MHDTGYDLSILYELTTSDGPIRKTKALLNRLPISEPRMKSRKSIIIPPNPGR